MSKRSKKSSTQTSLTDYFQNNRAVDETICHNTFDETICHNTFECKTPKSQSFSSKHCAGSNVSSIALVTAHKQQSNEKNLKNRPKFTKELPLAFNLRTFHNDKTFNILPNEPGCATVEKLKEQSKDK